MATALPHRVHDTCADYSALEAASNVKHEYRDGQIYAMAGGSPSTQRCRRRSPAAARAARAAPSGHTRLQAKTVLRN